MTRLGGTQAPDQQRGWSALCQPQGPIDSRCLRPKPNLNLIFFGGPVPFSTPGDAAPHRGMTTQPIATAVRSNACRNPLELKTTLSLTSKSRVPERRLTCPLDAARLETVYPLPCPFHICMEGGVLGLHNSSTDSQARTTGRVRGALSLDRMAPQMQHEATNALYCRGIEGQGR